MFEIEDTNLVTLSRHVLHSEKRHPSASGDLTLLLVSIQVACKFISSQVRRAGLANLYLYQQFDVTRSEIEQD